MLTRLSVHFCVEFARPDCSLSMRRLYQHPGGFHLHSDMLDAGLVLLSHWATRVAASKRVPVPVLGTMDWTVPRKV